MAIQYWMNYTIFFTDEAEYQFAIGVAGGNLLEMTPRAAASLFGIPFPYPSGDVSQIPKGIFFYFPFTPGTEIGFPSPSGVFVDDTILTVTVPGQAGNPPSIWPAGPDGVFTWSGNIIKSGAGQAAVPVPNVMSQRRFITGRELSNPNEGGSGIAVANMCRDASRTIDGMGWMIRGSAYSNPYRHDVNEFRTALQPRTSWERIYMRFRNPPTGFDVGIWRSHGFPSAAAGCGIKYMQSGSVDAFGITAVNTETNEGTIFTPVLNQWYRFDILLKYGSGSQPGIIAIYINGIFTFSFSNSSGTLGANSRHTYSEAGKWNTNADRTCEVDFDDWISADLPANCDPSSLAFIDENYPIDWLLGSHVRLQNTISASQTNWSPAGMAVGVENQTPTPQSRNGTSVVTSTTSGATLEGLTDALPQSVMDTYALTLGVVAAQIALRNINSGSTDGQLGYRVAGGSPVMATIDQSSTEGTDIVTYNIVNPTSLILPEEVSPWSTVHTKSANGNTGTVAMMLSVLEYLGIWGEEDDPTFIFPISRLTFLHNSRYGNTPWGYFGSQPSAPCFAVGGTYVGNGTYQEFTLPAPCQFLWIRGTSGSSQGCKFFGAAVGPHLGGLDRMIPNVRMWYDYLNQVFKFSVVGGVSSDINGSGTTYQYIAFCDPGMRFNLCGAFSHENNAASPSNNPLIDPGFLADAGFFQKDQDSSSSNIEGLYFRGPGSPSSQVNGMQTGTVVANAASFAAGAIVNGTGLTGSIPLNYSLWRTADSGGACSGIMVQIGQYTGNGSNPRNIPLTPTSGRFPLLVIVSPTNASAPFMRDPSHTSTNSTQVGVGTNSTTAITATAIDQITVGTTLNANGVIYNVFAICGGITNVNGTFVSDFCEGGGPYVPPEPPQGDINVRGNGGIDFDGTTPLTLLKDVSGIYTLIPGKRNDTLIDRQTGQPSVDTKIPDPTWKTGYVGG